MPKHLWLLLLFLFPQPAAAQEFTREGIEFFEKKIRPVLVENCFRCHSGARLKGKLALSSRAGMLKGGKSGPAIVPGDPDKSRLIKAIRHDDPQLRMPRDGKLNDDQIAAFTEWVKMGAPWPKDQGEKVVVQKEFNLKERAKHWSLQPLTHPDVPRVENAAWVKSPIDAFVLHTLEAKELKPAGPADKRTLLRRVTFDLIGLPPTPAEVAAFLKDDAPDAFAKAVDRLLASPHYGERWGRHWLDLVRYAETYGHEFDPDIADAYKYRDYVIRAFNDDVPFDQFVTEHIAGDLLAKPRRHAKDRTNESVLATAFWWLGEAKHSPVDVRSDQADRIDNQLDVFGKAFLGMTIACARCHDHKFDAISTKDYYALAGFLQSSRMDRAFLDDPEPRRKTLKRMAALASDIQRAGRSAAAGELEKRLDELAQRILVGKGDAPKASWKTLGDGKNPASAAEFKKARQAALAALESQAKRAEEALARAVVFADARAGSFRTWIGTGEACESWPVTGPHPLAPNEAGPGSQLADHRAIHTGRLSGTLHGTVRSPSFVISKKRIHLRAAGSQINVRLVLDGLQLIQEPIYGGLKFDLGSKELGWHTINVSMWEGHRAYLEFLDNGPGHLVLDKVVFSDDGPPPEAPNPLLVRLLSDPKAGSFDELAVKYQAELRSIVAAWKAGTLHDGPDSASRLEILNWMLHGAGVNPCRLDLVEQKGPLEEFRKLEASLPPPRRALATADGSAVNETVFIRGNHKLPGDLAPRRFLEVFGGADWTPPERGSGRLDLARHMTDPKRTPILPRVLVNRLWKHHFGEGIVRSPDDFGVLGQTPTHPDLLDFLASEFVKNGWSIKKMHRMMVQSSTYQMASLARPDADEKDPDTKWLHRMPVRRLEAEAIRDAMLAVSGRLDPAMFGPSVPPHLTQFMLGRGRPGSSGPLDGAGRRSIYLGVRRNFLNPMFLAFDYPTPFTTIGRRSVSNVPAQALTLLNNPFVLEQAELWAKKTLANKDLTPRERIEGMYAVAFARPPSEREMDQALTFLEEQARIHGRADDPRAWTELAHALFNVKEFIFVQ